MIIDALSKYNDGYKKVLLVIDIFSRYVWVRSLKSKTGKEVLQALQSIFAEGGKPKYFRTDQGGEFLNSKVKKYFKQEGIIHLLTYDPNKAAYAERAIQTIKNRLFRYMDQKQTYRYIDVMQDIVNSYNSTYHQSIKMAPKDVNKENEWQIFQKQYFPPKSKNKTLVTGKLKEKRKKQVYKFKIGDTVRITYRRSTFSRSYHPKWTGETFTIIKHYLREGIPVYKIADKAGEVVTGSFYTEELQKVTLQENEFYKIEKILKRRKRKGKTEYLVRWMHLPSKFDEWLDASQVVPIKEVV